jgi:hypothetical protein
MDLVMKVKSKMGNETDLVFGDLLYKTEIFIKVIIWMIWSKDLEYINGQTDLHIKELLNLIKNMELEKRYIKMVKSQIYTGKMAKSLKKSLTNKNKNMTIILKKISWKKVKKVTKRMFLSFN